ncbi:MAG: galactose-1-phosphate uridylyltransferase, partial [Anaerolineae bacterium]
MSELRQNMVTREWVIIATERARRPNRYAESREQITTGQRPPHDPACPFCPGNEEAELEVERLPADGPWQARAVENRYPALHPNQALARSFDGVQRRISGMGRHEIVTEHPRHNTTLALMTPAEVGVALELLFNRGWNIQKDYRIEQVIYFKNHRQRAGASLPHPHSQIIALPVVPHFIRQRAEQARRYFDDTDDCAYCVMLEDELRRQV